MRNINPVLLVLMSGDFDNSTLYIGVLYISVLMFLRLIHSFACEILPDTGMMTVV